MPSLLPKWLAILALMNQVTLFLLINTGVNIKRENTGKNLGAGNLPSWRTENKGQDLLSSHSGLSVSCWSGLTPYSQQNQARAKVSFKLPLSKVSHKCPYFCCHLPCRLKDLPCHLHHTEAASPLASERLQEVEITGLDREVRANGKDCDTDRAELDTIFIVGDPMISLCFSLS